MSRLHYFIHGRGRGHASRALGIIEVLERAGHELTLYAGGAAAELLGNRCDLMSVPPVLPGRGALGRLARGSWRTHGLLADATPDALLTDGDQTMWATARYQRLPTVAIGHDLTFFSCHLGARVPARRLWHQKLNCCLPGLLADHQVAVHFLPVQPNRAGVTVARPDPTVSVSDAGNDGHVLAYFRDPNGSAWLEAAVEEGAHVLAYGAGAPPPGVVAQGTARAAFLRHLSRSRAVIGSAGSNLLAECVLLHKPMLALYDERDHEQALNALLAEQAGVAMARPIHLANRRDVSTFLKRAESGDFAQLDLTSALPPVHEAVATAVTRVLQGTS